MRHNAVQLLVIAESALALLDDGLHLRLATPGSRNLSSLFFVECQFVLSAAAGGLVVENATVAQINGQVFMDSLLNGVFCITVSVPGAEAHNITAILSCCAQ